MINKTAWMARFCTSLLLVVLMVGCAATSTQESTGQYIDDSAITTKVKTKILDAPDLKSLQISVETYKGTVQLSGFVNSKHAVNRAEQLAKSVKGVTHVENGLVVRGSTRTQSGL